MYLSLKWGEKGVRARQKSPLVQEFCDGVEGGGRKQESKAL
jgi:hypothetical protein